MKNKKKENRGGVKTPGGKRKGAGRPKGEKTKAIGKRVPIRFHRKLVKLVEMELTELKNNDK